MWPSDLNRKEIEILMRWNQYGESRGRMKSPNLALLDHPLAQWAYELGLRAAGSR